MGDEPAFFMCMLVTKHQQYIRNIEFTKLFKTHFLTMSLLLQGVKTHMLSCYVAELRIN